MHIINCGISFSIIIKTTYLQAMMTALHYTRRNLIKVFILKTDKQPKKKPPLKDNSNVKTRYPPNIKLNHETNLSKSQCHRLKTKEKIQTCLVERVQSLLKSSMKVKELLSTVATPSSSSSTSIPTSIFTFSNAWFIFCIFSRETNRTHF